MQTAVNGSLLFETGEIAMNPMGILKLKPLLEAFKENHPKVLMFMSAMAQQASEGGVFEMKFTSADEKVMVTNMKLTDDDMKLLHEIFNIGQ